MQKKLMILGGSRFILPLIEKAHKMGVFVITCDYLPDNIAHKYSDMYCNISIIDKDAVLKKAQELKIDGISSFACDPGVVTATYVAEKMGLPNVGPYESVKILQDKKLFRTFLKENGFNVPWFFTFSSFDEVKEQKHLFTYPLIVKPTDSAGSKGVTRLDNENGLKEAFDLAWSKSLSGNVIIEEFLEIDGSSSSSDCFSIDGKLVFSSFSDQLFDKKTTNVYNPCGTIYPTSLPIKSQHKITSELQRLIRLLGMKTSIYNVESRLCTNGKEYLMEVSPRGGGNRIAELQSIAYDFDYLDIVLKATLGTNIVFPKVSVHNPSMTYVIHSDKTGFFDEIEIDEKVKCFLTRSEINVAKGEKVFAFDGANNSFGILFFRFNTLSELSCYSKNINKYVKVIVNE